jgi:hypothetical protein
MSNLISYVRAQGEMDTQEFGKVFYDITVKPTRTVSTEKLMSLKEDVQDFERYLQEKYVVSKINNIDEFSVWRKLKNAIKKIL